MSEIWKWAVDLKRRGVHVVTIAAAFVAVNVLRTVRFIKWVFEKKT